MVTAKLNCIKSMISRVTCKALQDRYEHIQSLYDDGAHTQRKMSGIGGEVSEMEEVLAVMKQDRDYQMATRKVKKEMKYKREKDK